MKKIIISSYDSIKNPHYAGGGAIAVHQVAKRLIHDFHITVITGRNGKNQDEIIDGVTYHQIGTLFQPQIDQLVFQICLIPRILNSHFDLWLESLTPPFSFSLLPIFSRKRVVGLVHMLAGADMQRKYRIPFKFAEKLGLKLYSRFIVTSIYFKTLVKTINPRAQIAVIGNGIEKITPRGSREKDQFLFIGRLEVNQKGLDLLVSAFNEFKYRTSARTRLIIAGSGSIKETRALTQLVAASPFRRDISVIGHVGGSVWQSLFSQVKAVIIPSRFETFSLTALEALSCGRPVISFAIPGLSWLPKGAAIQISPFSTSELAAAMAKLDNNIDLRNRMGNNGLQYAAQFTWDNISELYRRYLNQILEKI